MSNTLTKDTLVTAAIPGTPGIPAEPPHPAYCVNVTTTEPSWYLIILPQYDDNGDRIEDRLMWVSGPPIQVTKEVCYPASEGSPGEPATDAVPAGYNYQLGWNAGAISVAPFVGNQQFQFSVGGSSTGVVCGLNENNASTSYVEIDYGFFCEHGLVRVIEAGALQTTHATYTSGTVFTISRIGDLIRYYIGSTLVYTSLFRTSQNLFADASLYAGGDVIINASITAVTAAFAPVSASMSMDLGGLVGIKMADTVYVELRMDVGALGIAMEVPNEATLFVDLSDAIDVRMSDCATLRIYNLLNDLDIRMESGGLAPEFNHLEINFDATPPVEAVADAPFEPAVVDLVQMWSYALVGNVAKLGLPTSAAMNVLDTASFGIKMANFAYSEMSLKLLAPVASEFDIDIFGIRTADIFVAEITGRARLQPLETRISVSGGGVIRGDARLQKLRVASRIAMRGAGTLRALTAAGVLQSQHTITGRAVLPALYTRALGSTDIMVEEGQTITGKVKLARLIGEGRFAFRGAGTLLPLTATGVLRARETITSQILLPALTSAGTATLYGYRITGNLILPALIGDVGLRGAAILPALTTKGTLIDTSGVFEGWAYNVRTGATTRLTNLPFVQMLQVPGGNLLGIGYDGNVYELTGDTDAGAAIPWAFETGLSDMRQPGVKRIPYVYIDGIIAGTVQITVLTDDPNAEYTYDYTASTEAAHKPHRRKLGNRIRTRNLGFRMESTDGVYVEIDGIEPELDQTQRSV